MSNNNYFIFLFLINMINSINYTPGIDVSKYQAEIEWDKVAPHVKFVIIRAGYGINGTDEYFERNYKDLKRLHINTGVYWYAKAVTIDEAKQEAEACMAKLKDKKFEYPIYYDIEHKPIFESGLTNEIATTFCTVLEENNYYCGIYSSAYPFRDYFNNEVKSKYAIWVAQYNDKIKQPEFDGVWGIWQYSSKGIIEGIKGVGVVDMNRGNINYEPIIKNNHKNGY